MSDIVISDTIPESLAADDSADAFSDSVVYTYYVGPDKEGSRLDHFVAEMSSGEASPLSRSQAAKLCLEGRILIDGRPDTKNAKLNSGSVVEVNLPPPKPDRVEPENIPLDIVYEDSDIIVVNKPAGMVVHPSPGHIKGTLCAALLYHCAGTLSGIGGVSRPGIVHRIDMDTSGLIVCAKNDMAHNSLSAQIKAHTAYRTYYAILCGNMRSDSGTVNLPIGRNPSDRKKMAVITDASQVSREAVTHWRIIERYSGYCLAECSLETGRTHQIRVHMAYSGHPVLGDPLYGGDHGQFYEKHKSLICGQCLHAGKLEITHPGTGERMTFERPMPEQTVKLIEILRKASV